jgi:hypothetical protein
VSADEVIGPKYKFSPHKFHFKSNEQQQQQQQQQHQQQQQQQSDERTQNDAKLSSKVDDMFDYLKSLGKVQKNLFYFTTFY